MRFRNKVISATATIGLLSASLSVPISAALAEVNAGEHPFTVAEATLIHQGKIVFDDGSSTGLVDMSLVTGAVMDPEDDDDFDGIKNKDELHVYTKNSQQYLRYLSHPKLKDTDGDGLKDNEDPDKLSWNVHARDGVIYQELTYRDDDYQLNVLGQDSLDGKQDVETAYDKTMAPLPREQWYKDRSQYGLIRREVAPFWNAVQTWHTGSGFDATMYEFSNKTFPYLKDKSTHVLGIRGTAGAKDIAMDVALGLGSWMGQDSDAQNVAKELAAKQERFKNITVAGHSLGGYLSQMFFVASLGGKYGNKSVNGQDNYNYWNHDKVYNPEVKRVFGFNSPRITYNLFNQSLKEYYWLGKYLDRQFDNRYFQVNNDAVVRNHPDAVTHIGKSDAGHSSNSFWEKKFADVEGFSVGDRNDLSGLGYQEPALTNVRFIHRTIVKIQENGTELAQVVLPKTKDEISTVDKEALSSQIAPGIVIDANPINLKYGEVNILQGHIKKVNVTYKFMVEGQANPVATEVVKTKYKTDYTAPSIPVSDDQDYKYVLQVNPLPKVAVDQLTEDKTLTVKLLKEPILVSTKVIFKEGEEKVKSIVKDTKPSEGNPTLLANDFPQGYLVPDPLPVLTAGEDNVIKVEKKQFTLTFKYVDTANANAIVGDPVIETVKYGENSRYQLHIPQGYQLANGYSFTVPTDVKDNATIQIQIQPKEAENWQVNFIYEHTGKDGQTNVVGTQMATVASGDTVQLQLPSHADPNKSYVFKNENDKTYTVTSPRPTSGEQNIHVKVQVKVEATQINSDTVIHFYDITLNYRYQDEIIKTETKHLRQDTAITLAIPTSEAGTYSLADDADIPTKATKTQTIIVPLKLTPNQYPVTLRYIYSQNGDTQVLETENQQVTHGKQPVIKQQIAGENPGRYYRLKSDYQAPEITGPKSIDVPMEYVVEEYTVSIKYLDSGTQVGNIEVQQVKNGKTATLNLPTATSFDGYYLLAEDFNNPLITENKILEVPLKRQLNTYRVTVNYLYDQEIKANSFQIVESGQSANNDYDAVVNAISDEGHKLELQKYEVDSDFNWSKQILEDTTLNVPLKRKVQTINVPAVPDIVDPCGVNNATWVKPSDSAQVRWEITAEKHLVGYANDGYIFNKNTLPQVAHISADAGSVDYGVAKESGVICWLPIHALPQLKGLKDQSIGYGSSFDPYSGISAIGADGTDITDDIKISGVVDTAMPGNYKLTYLIEENGAKVSKTITVTVREKEVEPAAEVKMILGMGQKIVYGSNKPALFKSNGTYDPAVVKVYVDGSLLENKNYTARAGSVIVVLKPSYLSTLSLGKHTLGIQSKEGLATTDFYILAKPVPPQVMPVNKKTLATTGAQSGLPTGMGIVLAVLGFILCCYRRKNR